MRVILLLLAVLAIAGCKDNKTPQLSCSDVDLSAMSPEQRVYAGGYCDSAVKQREDQTMATRLQHEADTVGMPLNEFVHTTVGKVALFKELAAVVVGLAWVIGGWFAALLIIRGATWEEDSATRKKWGPFSVWEIRYRRRKNAFLDMSPTGWAAILGAVGFFVSAIVYATVAN